jgi:predicted SprT family Zn-dependent metalloprotease
MTSARGRSLEISIHSLLLDCGIRWGLPGFEKTLRVEWSRRFCRSLGRVHLERRVVRVSAELEVAPLTLLLEVLCHEAAHLAVRDLHRRRCQPHGPEWVALIRAAGFEPRRRIPWSTPPAPSKRAIGRRRRYVHRCPVCHFQRTASRPVGRWRCGTCLAAGLPGQLEISSMPTPAPTPT